MNKLSDENEMLKLLPKITIRDLNRSIRGFIGLYLHVTLYFPNSNISPHSTNQDDVENYFSLQRARGNGDPTVLEFFDNSTCINQWLPILSN